MIFRWPSHFKSILPFHLIFEAYYHYWKIKKDRLKNIELNQHHHKLSNCCGLTSGACRQLSVSVSLGALDLLWPGSDIKLHLIVMLSSWIFEEFPLFPVLLNWSCSTFSGPIYGSNKNIQTFTIIETFQLYWNKWLILNWIKVLHSNTRNHLKVCKLMNNVE